jgi:hypothetical protein
LNFGECCDKRESITTLTSIPDKVLTLSAIDDACFDDCGSTFDQCNDAFQKCMEDRCDSDNREDLLGKTVCRATAIVFAGAVRLGGAGPFSAATAKACDCVNA